MCALLCIAPAMASDLSSSLPLPGNFDASLLSFADPASLGAVFKPQSYTLSAATLDPAAYSATVPRMQTAAPLAQFALSNALTAGGASNSLASQLLGSQHLNLISGTPLQGLPVDNPVVSLFTPGPSNPAAFSFDGQESVSGVSPEPGTAGLAIAALAAGAWIMRRRARQ